jgi:hypothetical protein
MNAQKNGGLSVSDGRLTIDGGKLAFGPTTTHAELLATLPSARRVVSNGPWNTYSLRSDSVGGIPFVISLCFHGQVMHFITLTHLVEGDEGSWDLQREIARKRFHDEWLGRLPGTPDIVQYWWGRIDSVVDARGGESVIVIHYVLPQNDRLVGARS